MTLRVGFFGAGLIARYHAQSLLANPPVDVALVGVFDPDADRQRSFASDFATAALPDESAVFDRSDAVYVCTWTSEHPRLVRAAAARGLAVFCEKPLAVDYERAQEMNRDVTDAGVVNQVGLILRSSPAFHVLAALMRDPRAGRLMSIDFRDDQYLPVGGYYASSWRADYRKAGAGVLLEHSIHDIDILEFLAGPIRSLSCATGNFHGLPEIEDVASARFDFDSGAKGTLSTMWHDITERGNERRLDIYCERLWCSLDGSYWSGPIEWQFTGDERRRADGEQLAALARELGHTQFNPDHGFASAAVRGGRAAPDFSVAERAHALVDACYRSAAGGGVVVALR